MRLGRTVLRTAVGGLFMAHGAQKLFGVLDGPGIEGTKGMMGALGFKPADRAAYLVGGSELGGGALLTLGLLTPVGSAAIIGSMVQAIRTVHGAKGPWNTDGGWEYNAVLAVAALLLAADGPGALSLDEALGIELDGVLGALIAIAGAAAGPELLLEREAPAPQA